MSPRRNRPKSTRRRDDESTPLRVTTVAAPAGWHAYAIGASAAQKRYRCPGCDQWIHAGVAHVVAWQEGRDDERRHWHTPCWHRRVH